MPWFLMLQGSPSRGGQSPTYELQKTADVDQISQEMASSAAIDLAVAIPAVFRNGRQNVTLYVRPAAWGAWAFYELTEEERREMAAAGGPLANAIARVRSGHPDGAQQATAPGQQPGLTPPAAPEPPAGPSSLPRFE